MADQMSQSDFIRAISNAVRKNQPGDDEDALPAANNPQMPPVDPNDLSVAPGKPDPEVSASQQMAKAYPKPSMGVGSDGSFYNNTPSPPASNGINPDTGMPYYSPQAPMTPEQQDTQMKNAFKLQYLKNKASGQQ